MINTQFCVLFLPKYMEGNRKDIFNIWERNFTQKRKKEGSLDFQSGSSAPYLRQSDIFNLHFLYTTLHQDTIVFDTYHHVILNHFCQVWRATDGC